MAGIEKRKGAYRITVSLGVDENGKQQKVSTTWTPPKGMTPGQIKKELGRQVTRFEDSVKAGDYEKEEREPREKKPLPKQEPDDIPEVEDSLQAKVLRERFQQRQCHRQQQKIDGSITLNEFAKIWFREYAEKQDSRRTVYRYKELMKRIRAVLGNIPLNDLSPYHLILFYDTLGDPGIRTDCRYIIHREIAEKMRRQKGSKVALHRYTKLSNSTIDRVRKELPVSRYTAEKVADFLKVSVEKAFTPAESLEPLAGQTVLHYHRLLSSMLNTAVYWQIIKENPCSRVKPPKVAKKEARYLTEQDVVKLLAALEDEPLPFRVMVYLLLYTGMRRGELCGLEWDDIDFENEVLTIRRSTSYLPGYGVYDDSTKTEGSMRKISIAGAPVKMLKEYHLYLKKQWLKNGEVPGHNRLFSGSNGRPIRPDTVTGQFHDFVEKNSLPQVSIHSLRHTHATLLISNNLDIQTVSGRLGHARTSTTLNIYSHAIRSKDQKASETIGEIIPYRSGVSR